MGLLLKTSVEDGVLCVTVPVARLDAAVTRDFKSAIETAWTPGLARIDINLEMVEFVDSSGIGALITAYRKLPQVPGSMRLLHVRPNVRSMLEMLRLTQFFEIAS